MRASNNSAPCKVWGILLMRWCPVLTKCIQGNMKFRWGLSRVHAGNYHIWGAWKRCLRLFKVRCLSKPDPQSAQRTSIFPPEMQTNCGDFKPEYQFLFTTIRRVWRKSALIVRVKKNKKSDEHIRCLTATHWRSKWFVLHKPTIVNQMTHFFPNVWSSDRPDK